MYNLLQDDVAHQFISVNVWMYKDTTDVIFMRIQIRIFSEILGFYCVESVQKPNYWTETSKLCLFNNGF